jgi:hypothetical protein
VLAYEKLLLKHRSGHVLPLHECARNHILKFFLPYFLINHPAQQLGDTFQIPAALKSARGPRLRCGEICSRSETVMLWNMVAARRCKHMVYRAPSRWAAVEFSSSTCCKGDLKVTTSALDEAIYQNTVGNSQGYPEGLSWNTGKNSRQRRPQRGRSIEVGRRVRPRHHDDDRSHRRRRREGVRPPQSDDGGRFRPRLAFRAGGDGIVRVVTAAGQPPHQASALTRQTKAARDRAAPVGGGRGAAQPELHRT